MQMKRNEVEEEEEDNFYLSLAPPTRSSCRSSSSSTTLTHLFAPSLGLLQTESLGTPCCFTTRSSTATYTMHTVLQRLACMLVLLIAVMVADCGGFGRVWPRPNTYISGDTMARIEPLTFKIEIAADRTATPSSMQLLERAVRRYQSTWMFPFNLTLERQRAPMGHDRLDLDHGVKQQAELDEEAEDAGIEIDNTDPDKQVDIDLQGLSSGEQNNRETIQKSITKLTIHVTSCPDLTFGIKEGYTLDLIPGDESRLVAETCYGAIRGLETFSQLIDWDFELVQYMIRETPLTIIDSPRFPWRCVQPFATYVEIACLLA
jgi:hypothetical protein